MFVKLPGTDIAHDVWGIQRIETCGNAATPTDPPSFRVIFYDDDFPTWRLDPQTAGNVIQTMDAFIDAVNAARGNSLPPPSRLDPTA